VAVVNNAQREHQEFMHTVQAVAEENGAVLQALPPNGTAVFPADDAFAGLWARMAGAARVWRFSFEVLATPTPQGVSAGTAGERGPSSRAEVHGRATWVDLHWAIEIDSPVGSLQTALHMPGRHNVHNAMAAACAALAAGAPLWAVAQGLRDFQAVAGRSRLLRLERLDRPGHPLTLIDDTYNANPDSVRAAIEVLAELPGPRALILGDMGEVGEQGPAFHAEVGDFARQRGLEHCWTLGTLCAHAAAAYGHGARHFDSMDQLNAALGDLAQARSLLVKGSRFMRMERVVSAVQAQTREAG
jgi:UDP-N-acetylmuramoyl-tripeptide--D-alanyl-D-alanine ligase